ncbi:response regulator [Rhodocytophaga rosea]|uniref:histidine kinase n=1 Tax=Rhodocytophaga rosea TaxID=2704465 RepID=A0A6C0GE20_9BACT|nr:hybrid sensor histidine kinase/response regulator transcription factor [Rhodocytophaga rosea]QHT66188.1 response regulator [Rhodocytophaga rosea]
MSDHPYYRVKILIIWCLLFFIHFHPVLSQSSSIQFDRITTEHGLSHSYIKCIIQDRQGYMWFGTKDGLNRYDGYTFIVYKHLSDDTTSISNSEIRALYEDKSGDIWVGTSEGLNKFDKATGKFIRYLHDPSNKKSISDDYIQGLYQDTSGVIWIGTYQGLNKYDKATNSFILYQHKPSGDDWAENFIHTIHGDKKGNIWVGTNKGLSKFNPQTGSFIRFGEKINKSNDQNFVNTVLGISEDHHGDLWLATLGKGLQQFNITNQTFIQYTYSDSNPSSISNNYILSVDIDTFGNIWAGTQNHGLNKLDTNTGKFTHYKHDTEKMGSIAENSVTSIFVDRFHVLWVGTYAGGLSKYDLFTKQFLLVKHNPRDSTSLIDNLIYSMYEDQNHVLWVGTPKGLDKLDRRENTITHFRYNLSASNRTSSTTIHSIYTDKKGDVWLGLGGAGLRKVDAQTKQIKTYFYDPRVAHTLPHNFVSVIYEDQHNRLWIGTQRGLAQFDNITSKFIRYRFSFSKDTPSKINHIAEDKKGLLWMATDSEGLVRLDITAGVFTQFIPADASLAQASFNVIYNHIDKEGNIWISLATGGLYKFNPTTSCFTKNQLPSYPSTVFNGITEDEKGNLWLTSTSNGVFKFNTKTKVLRNYDGKDGLQGKEFYKALCKGKKGEIFIGGNKGMNIFHPDSIRDNPFYPLAVINTFKVFDQPKDLSNNTLTLPYHDNYLSFDFAALHYAQPEKNSCKYMLENIDKKWVQAGNRHYASYPNLEPGKYIFKVKAANADGVWSKNTATITIIITPPIWKTTWAYILYVIVGITVLYLGKRYVIYQERLKTDLKLKRVESERLLEMDQIKSNFFTNISHEFRTPLTLIISPLEQMLSEENPRKEFHSMYRNAKRLLQLINQLLYITKLESKGITLTYAPGELIHFIKNYVSSFRSLAESRQIILNFFHEPDEIFTSFDQDILEKIIYNLLSNAIKFTREQGIITVDVILHANSSVHEKKYIEIKVEDTGIGIPADKIHLIFNRFYQIDSSHTRSFEGTGIGLSITKELVELHGGRINVKSTEGEGTCFIIQLPFVEVDKQHNITKKESTTEKEKTDDGLLIPTSVTEDSNIQTQTDIPKPIMLIVEDNADLRAYVRNMFTESYHIYEASEGIEGLRIATTILPDIMISDVMMPNMDGIKLCKQLKADERTSHIPIILLTAKAVVEDKLEGLGTGADDYIVKPFHAQELLLRVNNLIGQRNKVREHFSRMFNQQSSPKKIVNSIPFVTKEKVTQESPPPSLSPAEEKFLEKVIHIIEQHLADPAFSGEILEKEIDMSHLQLYRKMKAITNQAPGEFIRKYRLKKAALLLSQKQFTVSQVAYQVGFTHMSHFTKSFRQTYHITPSEYADQHNKLDE